MCYINETLLPGERLVHRTRPHPVVFLQPAFLWLTGTALSLAIARFWSFELGLLAAAGVLAASLPLFSRHLSCEYGLTNKRFFIKAGWPRRQTLETTLGKVGVITVNQGLAGMLLDYGDVTVMVAGGGKDVLAKVHSPLEFRSKVFEQMLSESEAGAPCPGKV
ncbi:MAG TPA: hypothetical protein DEB40_08845 [Elusimicrobia bacterium]|nr:hypothetical protein [Elusimicrobiota bacterium]HBT61836.1 hypothetical protein [Elusimicrobiota bacterium]